MKKLFSKIKNYVIKIMASILYYITYPFKQVVHLFKWIIISSISIVVKNIVYILIKFYQKLVKQFFVKLINTHAIQYILKSRAIQYIRRFYRRHRNAFWGYLFISFWLFGYLVFTLTPLIQSIYFSMNKGRIVTMELEFIKFENYRYALFTDSTFPILLMDYVGQIIFIVPIAIVFALLIAMLINQKTKSRGFFRVIFFLPVVISTGPVMNALSSSDGATVPILNNVNLHGFIMENLPSFIYRPILSLFGQIIMVLWYTGIPTLIFLAGLQKIDRAVYEAAAIDGASPWESFWKVTLPAVKQFITVNIIYVFVTLSYYSGFAGNDIIDYIRQQSFDGGDNRGFGYGSAIAWIFFVTIVILISIFVGFFNLKRSKR